MTSLRRSLLTPFYRYLERLIYTFSPSYTGCSEILKVLDFIRVSLIHQYFKYYRYILRYLSSLSRSFFKMKINTREYHISLQRIYPFFSFFVPSEQLLINLHFDRLQVSHYIFGLQVSWTLCFIASLYSLLVAWRYRFYTYTCIFSHVIYLWLIFSFNDY